jgi:hypothetical protein
MNKNYLYIALALLINVGIGYYLYRQLLIERARNSISDTNTKAKVLNDKFETAQAKDKELKDKVIRPSDEDADKFWDRVIK